MDPQTDKEKIQDAILKVLSRIESASSRLEKVEKQVNLGHTAPPDANVPPPVREFDEVVSTSISPLLEVSVQIGDLVEELIDLVCTAIQGTRAFLLVASECRKSSLDVDEFARPIHELITEISNFCEKNKNTKFYDHLNIISKGMAVLSFVFVPAPLTLVQQHKTATEPLITKFLRDYKAKQLDCALAENIMNFVKGLEIVVQRNYATGITWNSTGKEPPPRLEFSTRGIPSPSLIRGIPKLQIDSSKIYCEYWASEKKEIDCEKKQSIYVLYCSNSNIFVKGKSSNVVIDGCSFSKITLSETSALTVSNCYRVEIVCPSSIGGISIDKTNGCTLSLTEPGTSLEVNASGSSNLFVAVPEEQGVEVHEIPTQIKAKVRHGKISSTLIEGNKSS